jgi:hypothetical protein
VLVLPRSSALSAAEARAIAEFVAQGGTVIADGVPGAYDEHSRKLERPQLPDRARDIMTGQLRAIQVEVF